MPPSMMNLPVATAPSNDLETPLGRVETRLQDLQAALRNDDAQALETAATDLHRALAAAVDHFKRAARQGPVPQPMRRRLALASAQVAAQRDALARATASLDRAIEVLLPSGSATYVPTGPAHRGTQRGALLA